MVKKHSQLLSFCGMIALCCAIMAVVDGVLQPGYGVKSAIKMVLFLALPLAYGRVTGRFSPRPLFRPSLKGLVPAVALGFGVFALILGGYMVLSPWIDFSGITAALEESVGVTGGNFLLVAAYIALVNSLLEEFFFRGFVFFQVEQWAGRAAAYLFGGGMFALYHVAMMVGWFSIWVLVLAVVGLFLGGVLFHWLNERDGTIYTSWLVHMCANLAINTVGCILFGILPL